MLLVSYWDQGAINEDNGTGFVEAAREVLVAVPVLLIGAAMDQLLQHTLEDVATASQAPLGLKPIDPSQQFCAQLQADAPPGLVTFLDHGGVLTVAAYRPPRDLITNCWFSRAC